MSAGLWTAYEAAAATGGALCARGGEPGRWVAEEWAAAGVSIDTRSLSAGDIFVALKDARDGHDFVCNAFERGAAAALVARAPEDTPSGAPLLIVKNTLDGLRDLGRAARDRNFGKRIAVTGSAGKTSVKEMLRTALAASGTVHAADKSFNNHWGVPLTLARLPMRADYTVVEIGMNHAGEITPLTRLARPHAAIVTTVAPAHLEYFGTVEKIAEAKAEIFLGVEAGGAAVLPIDNPHFDLLKARASAAGVKRLFTFGERQSADFRLIDYALKGDEGAVTASLSGTPVSYRLGAPGLHQAVNSLAVIAAIHAVGAAVGPAIAALARHAPAEGRGARRLLKLAGGGVATLIDESYNANPASMAAAIALLGAVKPRGKGRRIAILGDMLELGPEASALHAALAGPLYAARVERLYVAGDLMHSLWEQAPEAMRAAKAPTAQGLIETVRAELRHGDVVMVKGSNASKVSAIARALEADPSAPAQASA